MSGSLIVGYALNAKKLRKSSHILSRSNENLHITHGTHSPERDKECKQAPQWQGGGLSDILKSEDESDLCPDIKFIQWNPNLPADQQPLFDVLIHKLTEEIGADYSSDQAALNPKICSLQSYLNLHPSTVIVDPILAVRLVTNRARTCAALASIQERLGDRNCPFHQPRFIEVTNQCCTNLDVIKALDEKNIRFPVICKPVVACGTPNSHNMVSAVVIPLSKTAVYKSAPSSLRW